MKRALLIILTFFAAHGFAKDSYLNIKGFLGLVQAREAIERLEEEADGDRIIVQIDSSTGEIKEALSLAHKINDLKLQENKHVVVYIHGKAVGAAAILPFIADELITTSFVAWGDIPYNSREGMSSNQIALSVKPLINQESKTARTLDKLVDAMVDPHYQLVYQGSEGKIEKDREAHFDPLILNLKGMQSLGLVDQVLTDSAFSSRFLTEEHTKQIKSREITNEKLNASFKKYIKYSKTNENYIGYLHIGNERSIDQSTYIYVKFALKDFVEKGVRFVVLDLNTPGGEVLAALKIVDLLQKLDIQYKIPVVAFVNDWAISAGALLAYSCRYIAVEPGSIMGAAEPVIMGEKGQMVSASEKVNSALRAQFAALASFYDRNPLIAEAMVDKDMILVLRDHKIIQLNAMDQAITSGPHPDTIISGPGKLLTLKGKELMELGVSDFMVKRSPADALGKREMFPASESPIFEETFFAGIPHGVMLDYKDWRVGFFTFLTHPVIASLLFIGLVIGLYIEINTPGFGVPGSVALGCLALILLSSFASHAINWIEIIIVSIGLILLAIELFVIPGFGITGILGIILTIIGLFALMLPGIDKLSFFDLETFRLVGEAFIQRLAWLFGGLVFAIVVILLLARFFSDRYFRFSKLILKGEQEGYQSGIPKEMMPEVGTQGECVTPLRPAGKVHIGEDLFDAMSEGGFLKANTAVEVIKIEGSKVIVKEINEDKGAQ